MCLEALVLNKVGREFQLDFQANINLSLWFNFKKLQLGMEKLTRILYAAAAQVMWKSNSKYKSLPDLAQMAL